MFEPSGAKVLAAALSTAHPLAQRKWRHYTQSHCKMQVAVQGQAEATVIDDPRRSR
jgi:hypothetical protein